MKSAPNLMFSEVRYWCRAQMKPETDFVGADHEALSAKETTVEGNFAGIGWLRPRAVSCNENFLAKRSDLRSVDSEGRDVDTATCTAVY